MSFIPKPQEIYKHFKGNLYQITAVAEHTETGEQLVVYQALYGDFQTYARPLEMFTSRVDREKYPDVSQEFRFELQGPEARRQKAESDSADMEPSEEDVTAVRAQAGNGQSVFSEQSVFTEQSGVPQDVAPPAESSRKDEPTEGELTLDPLVLEFLDADNYEKRLNILAGLHHRITDDMITTMAISCDVEINDGDVEERYEALKTCLVTFRRYESTRLR